MKALALWAIRLYQRWISPNKGFRCAYAAHTGHASCSALGYRAIRRFGVLGGMRVLDARLDKCGVAHRRYRCAMSPVLARQAGFCDLDCGGADLGDLPCDALAECAGNLPCDGGWGRGRHKGCGWRRKNEIADRHFKLPPRPNKKPVKR